MCRKRGAQCSWASQVGSLSTSHSTAREPVLIAHARAQCPYITMLYMSMCCLERLGPFEDACTCRNLFPHATYSPTPLPLQKAAADAFGRCVVVFSSFAKSPLKLAEPDKPGPWSGPRYLFLSIVPEVGGKGQQGAAQKKDQYWGTLAGVSRIGRCLCKFQGGAQPGAREVGPGA